MPAPASDTDARAQLLIPAHLDLLARWRGAMNLVGPGPLQPHIDDALAAADGLVPTGRWADLGTGAGLPGLVWAARFPTLDLELVDSRRKRCTFLEEVLGRAGVTSVRVRCQRVETLEDASYDGITGRAFAPPPALLDHARRLLRPRGTVVLFLQADATVPAAADFTLTDRRTYRAGGKDRARAVLTYTG